ncbi:MAG: PH domain-containing protein [Planctomycetia bacterium]|nr:PH domain-containing protein [Planctomycetia bacterium]
MAQEEGKSSAEATLEAIAKSKTDASGSKSDPETVVWTGGHYSGKAFRVEAILMAFITLCFYGTAMVHGLGLYNRMGHWPFWALAMVIPVILWIRFAIRYWYYTTTIRYELLEDRLISYKGLFRQTTDTTLMLRVNDVQLEQTLWDKMINGGIGTVIIYSTDPTTPELRIACLDRPREAFDAIDHLVSEQAKRRGIKTFGGLMGGEDGTVGDFNEGGFAS